MVRQRTCAFLTGSASHIRHLIDKQPQTGGFVIGRNKTPKYSGRLKRAGFAGLVLLGLNGCAGGPTPETFDLTSPANFASRAPRGQLVVAEPVATLPVDSDRLVIRTGPETVAYLSGAQWADRLPRLVQTRLIASFENSHALKNVGRPGLAADNNLTTEIRRFEVDVTAGQAIVELSVKLVNDRSGRIRAAKIFTAQTPAPSKGPAAMAAALDSAFAECLRQIVQWTSGQV